MKFLLHLIMLTTAVSFKMYRKYLKSELYQSEINDSLRAELLHVEKKGFQKLFEVFSNSEEFKKDYWQKKYYFFPKAFAEHINSLSSADHIYVPSLSLLLTVHFLWLKLNEVD